MDLRTLLVWPLGAAGVLGAYFAAQAFQEKEDRARGYRTLVVTHGSNGAITAARICVGGAFLGGMLLVALGWLPRLCLIGAPLGLWVDRGFAVWSKQPGGGGAVWARRVTLRLLAASLLGLGLATIEYLIDDHAKRPVAGLATVRGHPPDRPLYPPAQMAVWEAEQAEE